MESIFLYKRVLCEKEVDFVYILKEVLFLKSLKDKISYIAIFSGCLYLLLGMIFPFPKITDSFIALIGLHCTILFGLSDSKKIFVDAHNSKDKYWLMCINIAIILIIFLMLLSCIVNSSIVILEVETWINTIFAFLTVITTGADAWINFYPPYKKRK